VRLQALAPGKVNLCLFVGGLRDDGRHAVVTVLESVSLADTLTLTTMEPGGTDEVVCPGVEGENLVAAALRALRARGWDAPPVRIEIDKRVPVAGGMGGGSADAAAALRLAQELAPGRPEEIMAIAEDLGSDVPGQLSPGLALGTGAGEEVTPLPPIAEHAWVIVPADLPLSTAEVYAEADRLNLPRDPEALGRAQDELAAALAADSRLQQALIVNDLQPAALSLRPEVAATLEALRTAGADTAIVSGSGPTAAGLVWGPGATTRVQSIASALRADGWPALTATPVGAENGAPRPPSPG